jgi:hypothetical protein
MKDRQMARNKYRDFVTRWKNKGVTIKFSFEQWFEWWLEHGIDKNLKQPRVSRGTLVMVQKKPSDTFTIKNAQLATYGGNDIGLPSSSHGVKRPHVWMYKDPNIHAKHEPYLRARAQWNFRGEENDLTFEEWCEFWTDDLWPKRGRASHELTLTRKDHTKPWTQSNCEIVDRKEQLSRGQAIRRQKYGTR